MRVVEKILTGGAAVILCFVALLVTLSVVMRIVFDIVVPDAFDLSTMTMSIVVFWGLSVAVHRDEHIRVHLFEKILNKKSTIMLDLVSQLVVVCFFALLAWLTLEKVWSIYKGGEVTTDLKIPIWIGYSIAWFGLALAVPLGLHRFWQSVTDLRKKS